MDALDLVHLPQLMEITAGRSDIIVGLIDSPVAIDHPDFAGNNIREVQEKTPSACTRTAGAACLHGTLVAGVLCAKRGSVAPAICPKCTLLARTVFKETDQTNFEAPNAAPEELAAAILACIKAGARVLNLSSLCISLLTLVIEGEHSVSGFELARILKQKGVLICLVS